MWKNVDAVEKRILWAAGMVAIGHLLLVAYAATSLHITVPTCQPNEKLFESAELRTVGEKRFEVHYIAKMWNFEPRKLTIPVGATVDFFLASKDVNHGFHVNRTNINLMAVPGVINEATHRFDVPGIYEVVCHEYCGFGHQNMNAQIIVGEDGQIASMDADTSKSNAEGIILSARAHEGKEIYQKKGCIACHSLNGAPGAGPSFKGLWGRSEVLVDGSVVVADANYITESINEPTLKVVKGFGPIMPKLGLSDEEIKNVIEFIKTVK